MIFTQNTRDEYVFICFPKEKILIFVLLIMNHSYLSDLVFSLLDPFKTF